MERTNPIFFKFHPEAGTLGDSPRFPGFPVPTASRLSLLACPEAPPRENILEPASLLDARRDQFFACEVLKEYWLARS